MNLQLLLLGALLASSAQAQLEDAYLGKWVEGELGAHRYTKMRFTTNTLSFAPGGDNPDMDVFAPATSSIWCNVNYNVVSRSQQPSYPDQPDWSRENTHLVNRNYDIRLLKLAHSKCTGFSFLQLAFPSNNDNYADVVEYDEEHRVVGKTHFHQLQQGMR